MSESNQERLVEEIIQWHQSEIEFWRLANQPKLVAKYSIASHSDSLAWQGALPFALAFSKWLEYIEAAKANRKHSCFVAIGFGSMERMIRLQKINPPERDYLELVSELECERYSALKAAVLDVRSRLEEQGFFNPNF